MTAPGPPHQPDPPDLPPSAPYAPPYVPPQQPPGPFAPFAPPGAAPAPPPTGDPAWPAAAQPGATTWPAAERPETQQHGALHYLDQTRSLVRGVTERVRTADQSELLRRGRDAGVRQAQHVRSAVSAIDTGRIATTAGQVGRTAASHGSQAARRTVSAIAEFGIGIGTFWRGLWAFIVRPVLWLYALLPAAILHGLTLASEAGVSHATRRLADWAAGLADDWWSVFRWLIETTVHWGVSALAYAVLGFVVIPLTLLVGAPFYVLVVRSLERRLAPPGPPAHGDWVRATGFVMSQTILLTLVVVLGGLVITPVLLIPGVNLLAATVIALVLNGFAIGLIAVGLPLHHRGVSGRREHLRYAWRHRWAVVGFGAMSVLVLSIPFAPLRWGSVPAVFVGAVLLQRRFPVVPDLPPATPMPAAPPGALRYGPPPVPGQWPGPPPTVER